MIVRNMRWVKVTGYGLAVVFAAVGIVFAAIPGEVLAAFNWLADGAGWPESSTDPFILYLGLALAYMYMVTLLAWQTARHPQVRWFPWLLLQAKAASAIVCLFMFALQEQYVIYLANAIVDGAIAVLVWWVCLRVAANPEEAGDRAAAGPAGPAPSEGLPGGVESPDASPEVASPGGAEEEPRP